MARIYVGRLRDGNTLVDVLLWDVRAAGSHIPGLRPPAPERSVLGAFDVTPHVRRIDGAQDEDFADLLCDLIESSWDQRTLRH